MGATSKKGLTDSAKKYLKSGEDIPNDELQRFLSEGILRMKNGKLQLGGGADTRLPRCWKNGNLCNGSSGPKRKKLT